MAKNLVLGPIFTRLAQTWAKINFWRVSPLLKVIHCCKLSLHAIFFQEKLINKT